MKLTPEGMLDQLLRPRLIHLLKFSLQVCELTNLSAASVIIHLWRGHSSCIPIDIKERYTKHLGVTTTQTVGTSCTIGYNKHNDAINFMKAKSKQKHSHGIPIYFV